MRCTNKFFLCVFLLCFSVFSHAQTNAAQVNSDQSDSLKIGFFNFIQVMANIPQAKEAEKRLGDEFAARKASIESLDAELKKSADELERDALVLSAAEQDAKKRKLRNRRREFKLLLEEYQEDLSLRQNQETASLQKLVRQAVLDVAKEGKFDLIIDQGAVLFASEKVNITAAVMQRLQKVK